MVRRSSGTIKCPLRHILLVACCAQVYKSLMEIESRLLPCGLHIVGCAPTAMEAIATLVNIGELDRPDNNPPVKVCLCEQSVGGTCFQAAGQRVSGACRSGPPAACLSGSLQCMYTQTPPLSVMLVLRCM